LGHLGFELFGFDILLDYKFRPWLLEVNLSPACTERSDWLRDMLDDMTEGMMKIVLANEDFSQPQRYFWERLVYEDLPPPVAASANNQEVFLEINGQKCSCKRERIIDRKCLEYL
jgi:hypothetical protein